MRLLILANETCASTAVLAEVRRQVDVIDTPTEVLVIAPALSASRLKHWLGADLAAARSAADERLMRSVAALRSHGIPALGELGDSDPLQALDDAIRVFRPDQVIIATHPPARSHWLEEGIVEAARKRFALPIVHVVADLEAEVASIA